MSHFYYDENDVNFKDLLSFLGLYDVKVVGT